MCVVFVTVPAELECHEATFGRRIHQDVVADVPHSFGVKFFICKLLYLLAIEQIFSRSKRARPRETSLRPSGELPLAPPGTRALYST
jgi:hypothetical protein